MQRITRDFDRTHRRLSELTLCGRNMDTRVEHATQND
jgi:hypothetical protein